MVRPLRTFPPRIALSLTILVLLLPRSGWSEVAGDLATALGPIVDGFRQAFPHVEGTVVAVEGRQVYLDLTEKEGAFSGMELLVYRKGDPFRHPLSGQIMGHYEEDLGWVRIIEVRDRFSTARLTTETGKGAVKAGDGVRITAAKIRVAVSPLLNLSEGGGGNQRAPYLFAAALERTGRFIPADLDKVAEILAREKVGTLILYTNPQIARRLAGEIGVAGWAVPVLTRLRGILYLDVTWISGVTGTPLFYRRAAIK